MDAVFAFVWFGVVLVLYLLGYLALKEGKPWDESWPSESRTDMSVNSVIRER